ncbi:MAG: hypothetical protein EXS32_04315 [Opitutus sp.]|nr:hypothetical protein [Opitutus sp.]
MKHLRLALLALAATASLGRAQDEQRGAPPTEIPDFSNLDDYFYVPKSTLIIGLRHLSGAKTTFFGTGKLLSPEALGPLTGTKVARAYHDGNVGADARVAGRLDSDGNPIIDPSSGTQIFDPIAPDGKTSTWAYLDAKQAALDGFVAFRTYSAEITDRTLRRQNTTSTTNGLDISVSRDMGKLFGTRATWSIVSGVSVNDLKAATSDRVQAALTTITDLYSLDGQALPTAPYSAPSSTTITVVDSAGNAVLTNDGTTQTVTIDTTTLLGSQPVDRNTKIATDSTSVTNHWKIKGSYFTFRSGPAVWLPISTRLRATVGIGAAVVYAGNSYTVTQSFQPETGTEITTTTTETAKHLLPGYFADASLQFDLTERAGFFAGAVFQTAGSYTQTLSTDTARYSTKINLANQQGLRAGMTIRF